MQKIGLIRFVFFMIFMLLFQLPSQAQSKKHFVITGNIMPEAGEAGTGIIEVIKNGKEKSTIEISKNLRFKIVLDFFNEYSLNFKYPGHFNKYIIVSTELPQDVWARDNDFPAFRIVVQLLKEFEGIDKSITLKPSGKIFYEKKIDNFEKESYISDIQYVEQIETAKIKANQVQKESLSISKEDAQDLATKQKNFDQLIKEADAHYQRGEFQMAYIKYLEAKKLFPEKAYANDRVAELQDLVKALEITEKQKAELEQQYEANIVKANSLYAQKSYKEARPKYEEALQYRPGDVFANGRIKEIDQLLSLFEKQKLYNDLIAQADKTYKLKNLDQAIDFYTKANQLIPADTYSPAQINLIKEEKQQQSKLAQLEKDFNQSLQTANTMVQQKDYMQAISFYKKALELKPDHKLAKDKIAETEKIVADQNSYNESLKNADQLFASLNYTEALTKYKEAAAIKPIETYPKSKIKELEGIFIQQEKEKAKKEKDYQAIITLADRLLEKKDYATAQAEYKKATQVKSDDTYPKKQLEKIDELLAQQKAEIQQNEQQYQAAINKADNYLVANKLEDAIASYKEALKFKVNDSYANKRLGEITTEYNRLSKLQEQYNSAITEAENDFRNKEYQKSKEKYQKASNLKPSVILPKEQIAKIDQLLEELQKETDINRQYAQYIKSAQSAVSQNKLKEAKESYQKANQLKPAESEPPMRIAEIDKTLAQQEETALIAAQEKARREAKEKADNEKYSTAISTADKLFAQKQYLASRAQYSVALSVMPNEKRPKSQIDKIDEILALEKTAKIEALKKAQRDSIIKSNDLAFSQIMTAAKDLEQRKQYSQAILKYKEAILINIGQRPAIQKLITNIEDQIQLLAKQDIEYKRIIKLADGLFSASKLEDALDEYRNAIAIKADEEHPKKQINEIQKIFAARDESYDSIIKNADKAYDASDWQNAKTAYTEALNIKKNETYPTSRLKDVNQKIENEKQAELNKQAELKSYNEAIEKAEKAFKEQQFTTARLQFEVAKILKPAEQLPVDRIKDIDNLIEQRNKDRQNQTQQEIDDKYRQAISLADNSFRDKSYTIAKLKYKQAQLIKPDESYPKSQIELIDKLANEAAPMETYTYKLPELETAKPTTTPVFNPEETMQATEARAKSFTIITDYDEAIKKADNSFGIKDYSVARFFYLRATEIRPKEEYPKSQLELIQKLIDSQLSANDLSGYENAIKQADAAFSKETYSIAKYFYYKALEIKSWEKYPKDQINEILIRTNSLLSEQEEKAYRDIIAKADEAYFNKDIAIARFYYNKAIPIKKDESYPQIKIKDIQKLVEQDKRDKKNQEYRHYIELADDALKLENYSIARFNYNKALTIKPEEKYPLDQLKRIKEALNKK